MAFFAPFQGDEATGGMNLSDPIGGEANGMPRKTATLASMPLFIDLKVEFISVNDCIGDEAKLPNASASTMVGFSKTLPDQGNPTIERAGSYSRL